MACNKFFMFSVCVSRNVKEAHVRPIPMLVRGYVWGARDSHSFERIRVDEKLCVTLLLECQIVKRFYT